MCVAGGQHRMYGEVQYGTKTLEPARSRSSPSPQSIIDSMDIPFEGVRAVPQHSHKIPLLTSFRQASINSLVGNLNCTKKYFRNKMDSSCPLPPQLKRSDEDYSSNTRLISSTSADVAGCQFSSHEVEMSWPMSDPEDAEALHMSLPQKKSYWETCMVYLIAKDDQNV